MSGPTLQTTQSSEKEGIEEREFKCEREGCTKSFKSKYSLKRHYLSHLEVKKFECHICKRRFTLKQYLKEHIYTHTGEKPYLCPVEGCGQRFRQASKLSLHRKSHKLEQARLQQQKMLLASNPNAAAAMNIPILSNQNGVLTPAGADSHTATAAVGLRTPYMIPGMNGNVIYPQAMQANQLLHATEMQPQFSHVFPAGAIGAQMPSACIGASQGANMHFGMSPINVQSSAAGNVSTIGMQPKMMMTAGNQGSGFGVAAINPLSRVNMMGPMNGQSATPGAACFGQGIDQQNQLLQSNQLQGFQVPLQTARNLHKQNQHHHAIMMMQQQQQQQMKMQMMKHSASLTPSSCSNAAVVAGSTPATLTPKVDG